MMVAIMINTNKQRNDREGIFECATLTLSLFLSLDSTSVVMSLFISI